MLNQPIIALSKVSKTYTLGAERIEALRGVSLDIQKGAFVAITGPSGGGKSTLLQMIGGLDLPTTGDVKIDGTSLSTLSDKQLSEFRNKRLGFVFQFFYLQPFLTVGQNIMLPAMFSKKPEDANGRLYELAALVGIEDRIKHKPSELSGGQMQRCSIARALFNNPTILLADEPTGNLDSTNARAIMELFNTIRVQLGTTVVMVTHDNGLAAKADRIVTIKDGSIE